MSKKILIVDDNAVILGTISAKLKARGYAPFTALDGAEAISMARREKPDLILLDISFPPDVSHGGGIPWDGFLIIEWLRRTEEGKKIPIIVITGGQDPHYEERSLEAGAAAFFRKPIESEELLGVICKTIGEGSK